jgi:hypothetical protein
LKRQNKWLILSTAGNPSGVDVLNHGLSGDFAKSINVCIGILPWEYFSSAKPTDTHETNIHETNTHKNAGPKRGNGCQGNQGTMGSVGCSGYRGLIGPLRPGQKIVGHHDENMGLLMIIIYNRNHEEHWADLTAGSVFLNLLHELKSSITPSTNTYARALDIYTLTYGPGQTLQGLFLRDEYLQNYSIAKIVMPKLTPRAFVCFQEDSDEDSYHDPENQMLIQKPINESESNDSDTLVYCVGKIADHSAPRIIDKMTFNIPGIDLPKITPLFLQLIKLFE